MGLYEAIREEEEQLKAGLETADDDTIDPQVRAKALAPVSAVVEESGTDADDLTVEDEPDTEDKVKEAPKDTDASSVVDEANKAREEKTAPQSENSLAAQLRISKKQQLETQAQVDRLMAEKRAPVVAQPTAVQVKVDETVHEPGSAEARLAVMERRQQEQDQASQEQDLQRQAVNEFVNFENEFKATTPDYEAASSHMIRRMTEGVAAVYPAATPAQVSQFVRNQVLQLAGKAATYGVNPAEALYAMAHEKYGYTKAAPKVDPKLTPTPKEKAEDAAKKLALVNKNKQRSASPLTSGGQNGSPATSIEEAAEMNLADFSKLSAREIDQMIHDSK